MSTVHSPGACAYCADTRSPRRKALFRHLQVSPNIPSARVARLLGIHRQTVVEWRQQGEERGCIPLRTLDGRRANVAMPKPKGYPIGTTWTAEATQRAA